MILYQFLGQFFLLDRQKQERESEQLKVDPEKIIEEQVSIQQ
jgi:hypothetical protein